MKDGKLPHFLQYANHNHKITLFTAIIDYKISTSSFDKNPQVDTE